MPVELAVRKPPTQHEASCRLAVVLSGGRRIEVNPDFDTNTFERLVSALEPFARSTAFKKKNEDFQRIN